MLTNLTDTCADLFFSSSPSPACTVPPPSATSSPRDSRLMVCWHMSIWSNVVNANLVAMYSPTRNGVVQVTSTAFWAVFKVVAVAVRVWVKVTRKELFRQTCQLSSCLRSIKLDADPFSLQTLYEFKNKCLTLRLYDVVSHVWQCSSSRPRDAKPWQIE